MAASPNWKVYAGGAYRASCHEIEAALVLAEWYGDGATVRHGHRAADKVFTVDSASELRPSESIDACLDAVNAVLAEREAAMLRRWAEEQARWNAEHGRGTPTDKPGR